MLNLSPPSGGGNFNKFVTYSFFSWIRDDAVNVMELKQHVFFKELCNFERKRILQLVLFSQAIGRMHICDAKCTVPEDNGSISDLAVFRILDI